MYTPSHILVPELSIESPLINLIDLELHNITNILPTKRTYYNPQYGVKQLMLYGKSCDIHKLQLSSDQQYLLHSSIGCLFYYIQHNSSIVLHCNTINIKYHTLDNCMYIEPNTMKLLKLVSNKTHVQPHKYHKRSDSTTLFDILNYCNTTAGAKLLRCFLLQPTTDIYTIQQRHNIVNYLSNDNNSIYHELISLLPRYDLFTNIIQQLVTIHLIPSSNSTQHVIINILQLRNILIQLESLDCIVQKCRIPDINVMHNIYSNTIRTDLITAIDTLIESDIELADNNNNNINAESTRINIIVAIKPDINSLLDLARKQFIEYLPSMYSIPIYVVYTLFV